MHSSEQPLVSVIIASYNHADYIEASINSVLAQTYPNIELLVIDDGSKDDSVERLVRAELDFLVKVKSRIGEQRIDLLLDYPSRRHRPPIFDIARTTGVPL